MSVNPTLIVALLLVSGGFLMAQDSATPAAADAPAAAPQSEMQKWIATTDEKWQALFKRDVTDVHLTELEKLKQQYVASLEAAVTKASGAGDLDGAVALRNEEKRFAGTNLFPEQDEATDAATVKQIRAAVRAQIAKLEKDTAARTKALHAKYDAVLGDAQARLTKVQRLEDALLVKAKREEVAAAWLAGIPAAPLQSTLRRADAASAADDPLDTLAQQAPNAIAWVLAPLNAAVPPDIRQNVTFLREGMLDDSAKTPKASLDAYKSGEQLCNTMIAALDDGPGTGEIRFPRAGGTDENGDRERSTGRQAQLQDELAAIHPRTNATQRTEESGEQQRRCDSRTPEAGMVSTRRPNPPHTRHALQTVSRSASQISWATDDDNRAKRSADSSFSDKRPTCF